MMPVTLIGAGNVAWHLGHAFVSSGITVHHVWSRNPLHAQQLAKELGCTGLFNLDEVCDIDGLVILTVPDHAIIDLIGVFAKKQWSNSLFVHTSGGTTLDVFPKTGMKSGVFYPLQTLTYGHNVDFSKVPILISAFEEEVIQVLMTFAQKISTVVYRIKDEERAYVHLAAVIVNNFVNHLGGLSQLILRERGLDKTMLDTLILETMHKVLNFDPKEVQTGPARRGDMETIHRHLKLLSNHPGIATLYRQLSLSINPGLKI
jgi:predicted short-subunit dehydrogenase-like oxidoreductase (DUF2520 family)